MHKLSLCEAVVKCDDEIQDNPTCIPRHRIYFGNCVFALILKNDDSNKSFFVNETNFHLNYRTRKVIAYSSSGSCRIFCGCWFFAFFSESIWLLDGISNRDLISAILARVTSVQSFKSNSRPT